MEFFMQIISYKVLEQTLYNIFKAMVSIYLKIDLKDGSSHSLNKICTKLVTLYKKELGFNIHLSDSPNNLVKSISLVYKIF